MIDERDLKNLKELDKYLWRNGDYVRVYTTYDGSEMFVAEWEPTIDSERDYYKETKRFTLDEIDECIKYAFARHDKFAEVWNVEQEE